MRMGIEDAGRHASPAGIDDAGRPPAAAQDLGGGADRGDPAVANRECPGFGPRRIEGEDASVVEDEVGFGHRRFQQSIKTMAG